jgi:hypothetical protein
MNDIRADAYALIFLVFWILWTMWVLFCILLFFRSSIKNSYYIKSRAPWLILMSAIGSYLMITSLTFKIVITPEEFPGMVDHWFIWLALPLHFVPYPVRALRFVIRYNVATFEKPVDKSKNERESRLKGLWAFFKAHDFLTTDQAAMVLNWIVTAIAIIVGLYRNITVAANWPTAKGTSNSTTYFINCLAFTIVVSIFQWIVYYLVTRIQDELKYAVEMRAIGILWIVFIGLYVITGLAKAKPSVLPSIILIILSVCSFLVSFGMPLHLAIIKPPEGDLGIDVLDDIDKLMADPKGSQLFLKYLEKAFCEEVWYFYKAVQEYRVNSGGDDMEAEYNRIATQFIGAGAPQQVNIPDYMVKEIHEKAKMADIGPSIFNNAFAENRKVMVTDQFSKFRNSPSAKEYAKELRGIQ